MARRTELFNPCPTATAGNIADCSLPDAEHRAYILLRHAVATKLANLSNVIFGKAGVSILLPAHVVAGRLAERSMIDAIYMVGLGGIPSQIFDTVIRAFSVLVAGFTVWRARTYEGLKHDLVNVGAFAFAVTEHSNSTVSILHLLRLDDMGMIEVYPTCPAPVNENGYNNSVISHIVAEVRRFFYRAFACDLLDLFRYHTSSMYTFIIPQVR